MPVEKRYIAKNTVCKATFILPPEIAAHSAYVVGDFNGWDEHATPMTQLKSGVWKTQVRLEAGKSYQYRYLVNGSEWHNDSAADRYMPNPYGGDNSVVDA